MNKEKERGKGGKKRAGSSSTSSNDNAGIETARVAQDDGANSHFPSQAGPKNNRVILSPDQILALADDTESSSFRTQRQSLQDEAKTKTPVPNPMTIPQGPEAEVDNKSSRKNAASGQSSLQKDSKPGAYQVDRPTAIDTPAEDEEEEAIVVAAAIDKEELKNEIRQELMAITTSAHLVEVPHGQNDSELSSSTSRKWWIILAIVFIVVAGIVAVVVILTDDKSGGEGGGGKKKD